MLNLGGGNRSGHQDCQDQGNQGYQGNQNYQQHDNYQHNRNNYNSQNSTEYGRDGGNQNRGRSSYNRGGRR